MSRGFWIAKGTGHLADPSGTFESRSRIEQKRSHQWFVDSAEPEFFSNKKQALQAEVTNMSSELTVASIPPWEDASGLSHPHQFMNRLFGCETRLANFGERNMPPAGTHGYDITNNSSDDQFGQNASAGLSMAHAIEDHQTSLTNGGFRKVKVNRVKDSDHNPDASRGHSFSRYNDSSMQIQQSYNRVVENGFTSVGPPYNPDYGSFPSMGHSYSRVDPQISSAGSGCGNGDDDAISMNGSYNKEEANVTGFTGFPDEQDIMLIGRTHGGYDKIFHQSSAQASETAEEKNLDASNSSPGLIDAQAAETKVESMSRRKQELRTPKKDAPNSFPSNVRSLISTGMLEGVPVKYASMGRKELRGIIKGSGYLCGCSSCDYSKVLNAYEFERHAGCKTKHPNNHIYFENGKTIYQIVQELRSTPESLLFDTIQTIFGAPVNQKAFHIWKESFQAATRELQRIYGKEELNL